MNNTNSLLAVATATKDFAASVIQSAIDASEHGTTEEVVLECFKRALLAATASLEEGALLSSITDRSERLWLDGFSSDEIAESYGVPSEVVVNAIDNRKEIVRTMQDQLESLPI